MTIATKPCAYLDTSSYLSILFKENNWNTISEIANKYTLCTSSVLFIESQRSIIHTAREKRFDIQNIHKLFSLLDDDIDKFNIKELTMDICRMKYFPLVSTPKSLDLIHLRTALWFREKMNLNVFISNDQNQRNAALEFNFQVLPI